MLAFGGDLGGSSDAFAALAAINAVSPDAFFIGGDMSYDEISPEAQWCAAVEAALDPVPLFIVSGNHEEDSRVDGFIGDFVAACDNHGIGAGYGVQYSVDLGHVTVIAIVPDLKINGYDYRYSTGSSERAWLEARVAEAKARGDWVAIVQHKLCWNIDDNKTCEIGTPFATWLDANVDFVLHGHEHIYQRTLERPAVWIGSGIVGSRDSTCVGSVHADRSSDPDFDKYVTSMCEGDVGWGHGFTLLTFTDTRVDGEFVNWQNPGGYTDVFTIVR